MVFDHLEEALLLPFNITSWLDKLTVQVWAVSLTEILKAPILVLSTYFYKILLPRSSVFSIISTCLDHSQLDLISHLVVHLKKKSYNSSHKGHLICEKNLVSLLF